MKKKEATAPILTREDAYWMIRDHKITGIIRLIGQWISRARRRIRDGFCERDIWSIDHWFLFLMPSMLEELRDTRHGSPGYLGKNYTNEKGILVNDTCHEEWTKILDRMIFLLREMNEETCSRKNPYEEEYHAVSKAFYDRYGAFGEGLLSEEEKKKERGSGAVRILFPDALPENKAIHDKYFEELKKLYTYRDECKNEFFRLFAQHFWALWD